MHYWRLLLLAFLATFQPIASFNERRLVYGRQVSQVCSEHRDQWDSRLSIYGNYRHAITRPADERRVDYQETREACPSARYEVREGHSLTRSARRAFEFKEREEARKSSEQSARLAKFHNRARGRDSDTSLSRRSTVVWSKTLQTTARRQRSREDPERLSRDGRQNERHLQEHYFGGMVVERRAAPIDLSRLSVDTKRDSRRNGDFLRESQRASGHRIELHRSIVEVANMQPARQESRISMEQTRQTNRGEIFSRRDVQLLHRDLALGRAASDFKMRSSSFDADNRAHDKSVPFEASGKKIFYLIREEKRQLQSWARLAIDNRDLHHDIRDFRHSKLKNEARERSSTDLRSRHLYRSRTSESRRSHIGLSNYFMWRSNAVRLTDLKISSKSENRLADRFTDFRSQARSRSFEDRSLEQRSSRDLESLERRTNEISERRSIETTSNLYRSVEAHRPMFLEARSSDVVGRSKGRFLEIGHSDKRAEMSIQLQRSKHLAFSRNVEPISAKTERLTAERRDTRRYVQNRDSKRSAALSRTNEKESRRVLDHRSESSILSETLRNERVGTRVREIRRTVSETQIFELKRTLSKEFNVNGERRSVKTERPTGTGERRDTQSRYVQNNDVKRLADLSRRTNEKKSRGGFEFSSESTDRLETKHNKRAGTRDREERRTVSESQILELKRTEMYRNRDMERRESCNFKSNRHSGKSRNRKSVEARRITILNLERDAFSSRTRASIEANRIHNAWSFLDEKLQKDAQKITINWQYLLCTIQGIYFISIVVKAFGENKNR